MKLKLIISALLLNYSASIVSAQLCDCSDLSMIGSGRNCLIINRSWKQSLFFAADSDDGGRRQVFTWIPGAETPDFTIETLFTDSGLKFKLKALYRDEYLYAANDQLKFDKDRRNVFSRTPKCDCNQYHWEIQPVPGGSGYVTIKSTKYDEYLYAAQDHFNFDADHRRVFTWKYTSKDVPVALDHACHWTIKCD